MGVFGFPDPYTSDKEFGKIIKEAADNGLIIAELEKIKAEMRNNIYFLEGDHVISWDVIAHIIGNHIAELKGE